MSNVNPSNRGCIALGDKVLVLQHPKIETHYDTFKDRAIVLDYYLFGNEEESAQAETYLRNRGGLQ